MFRRLFLVDVQLVELLDALLVLSSNLLQIHLLLVDQRLDDLLRTVGYHVAHELQDLRPVSFLDAVDEVVLLSNEFLLLLLQLLDELYPQYHHSIVGPRRLRRLYRKFIYLPFQR